MTNVIDRARERIERDGWRQGGFGRPGGSMCVAGAVMHEGQSDQFQMPSQSVGLREIADEIGCGVLAIATWNDDPSTSLEDVLLVLKRASARLDEERAS